MAKIPLSTHQELETCLRNACYVSQYKVTLKFCFPSMTMTVLTFRKQKTNTVYDQHEGIQQFFTFQSHFQVSHKFIKARTLAIIKRPAALL